jgi:hypothetical protein
MYYRNIFEKSPRDSSPARPHQNQDKNLLSLFVSHTCACSRPHLHPLNTLPRNPGGTGLSVSSIIPALTALIAVNPIIPAHTQNRGWGLASPSNPMFLCTFVITRLGQRHIGHIAILPRSPLVTRHLPPPRLQDGNARTNGGLRGFFSGAYTGADHPGHVFVLASLGGLCRCATTCSFRETSPLERGRQQAISYC